MPFSCYLCGQMDGNKNARYKIKLPSYLSRLPITAHNNVPLNSNTAIVVYTAVCCVLHEYD
jgi:hypothetical protein